MFALLLLLCVTRVALGAEDIDDESECSPGFADTCYTSVTDDLKYMVDLNKMTATDVSEKSIHNLCMALDDSLNCTSEIIDSDCSSEDGKDTFDAWIRALRGALRYVCGGNERNIKEILQGISCWNIEDFVLCTEEKARLDDVGDLLHTKLNDEECENLHLVTSYCFKSATVGSCREQEIVFDKVRSMLRAFFDASHCVNVIAELGVNSCCVLEPLLSLSLLAFSLARVVVYALFYFQL